MDTALDRDGRGQPVTRLDVTLPGDAELAREAPPQVSPTIVIRERLAAYSDVFSAVVVPPLVLLIYAQSIRQGLATPAVHVYGAVQVLALLIRAGLGRRASVTARAVWSLGYLYAMSIAGLAAFGPRMGIGAMLLAVSVAAAVFFSYRATVATLVAVLLGTTSVAIAMISGALPLPLAGAVDLTAPMTWFRHIVALGVTATAIALMEHSLVSGLSSAAERAEQARRRADEAQAARAQAQDALSRAQRLEAVARLAGGVAHDVNNALAVILCTAEELGDQAHDRREVTRRAEEIVRAAKGAAGTTRQLLAFARKEPAAPGNIAVSELVREVSTSLERMLPDDIAIVRDLRASGHVAIDAGRFEQVVLNLAINARDAMPRGGTLALVSRDIQTPGGPAVLLEVRDTGTGMDEATLARAFEPFFTTKGEGRGTGLGLAMVYGTVQGIGGSVEVHSRVGQGTVLTLRMPALPRERAAGSAAAAATTGPHPVAGNVRVLVVEDEDDVRAVIVRALQKGGYEVESAADGAGAHAHLDQAPPFHLLVTDAIMPRTDTPGLIDRFMRQHPGAPVIVCSGYVEEELVRRGIETGRVQHLAKPFTRAELAAAVRHALRCPDEAGASAAAGR